MSDELTPRQAAAEPRTTIIDIREKEERYGGLGYVPGSIWVPASGMGHGAEASVAHLDRHAPVALVCNSGRRSRELLPAFAALGFHHVKNLEGGVLGWADAGLPVCGTLGHEPEGLPSAHNYDEAGRRMLSCFVAESIEQSLSGEDEDDDFDEFDPKAAFDAFVNEEKRRHDGVREVLMAVLDRLADLARHRGHPPDRIAENVDRMAAMIRAIDPEAFDTEMVGG